MEIKILNEENCNNLTESSEKQRIIFSSIYLNKRISQAKSLVEFYSIIDKINANTRAFYENNFFCKDGCSRCCKIFGTPLTYDIEWANIEKHLSKCNNEFIEIVYKKHQKVKENFRAELKVKSRLDTKFIYNEIECPFLINNSCSIYTVRPLICRIFGFSIKKPTNNNEINNSLMYTCDKEKQRWDEEIKKNKYEYLLLPHLDFFIYKLQELNLNKNHDEQPKEFIYYLNKYLTELYE